MKRFAGHGVINGFVAGDAALANGIEKDFSARRGGGNFIEDLETCGVRSEQFVLGVFVGFRLKRGSAGALLRRQRFAARNHKEDCDRNHGELGHKALLLESLLSREEA